MVKDAEEALKRLEEELKGVEEPKTPPKEEPKAPPEEEPKPSLEDILNDEELNRLLHEQDIGQEPAVFENEANGYGSQTGDFSSDYDNYNQDTKVVKLDLEQITEEKAAELPEEEEEPLKEETEEPQEKRKIGGIVLMLVILGLMAVVTGTIAWMLLKL